MKNIGIIGGADGPTAVFVTSSPGGGWLIGGLVLLLTAGILFWTLRRNKK